MDLEGRDLEILRHVGRFGMTTAEVLHRLFFAEASAKAVERVTTRLLRQGILRSYPLYERRVYYRMSAKVAKHFGRHERLSRPLDTQARIRAYGTLAFCCLGPTHRKKLTTAEFRAKFPAFRSPEIPDYGYYLDSGDKKARLGLILVDHGADFGRIVRKCRHQIQKRLELPEFRELIRKGLFVVSVVTATKEKKTRLSESLAAEAGDVEFRVEAVPELASLLR